MKKSPRLSCRPTHLILILIASISTGCASTDAKADGPKAPSPSFAEFDQKARNGIPMSVVFFGGSLTWGANASDPNLTSYRGDMAQYLREKYPKCPFTFWDAAIGGTGSRLGMFRLERDVLSRHPDLVFYDFSANDDLDSADHAGLVSYETILREMVGRGIPVVQAYLSFRWNFEHYVPGGLPRVVAHQKLADAYHTAVGNTFTYVHDKLAAGADINALWAIDPVHPDDAGYRLFFEAVRDGLEQAIADKRTCIVPPQPVFGFDYHQRTRIRLVDQPLPAGWARAKTFRTSLWFDGLSSRWMDDVAVADIEKSRTIEPVKLDFVGTTLGIFGEADQDGLGFTVKIDDKVVPYQPDPRKPPTDVWPANTMGFGGNGRLFFWRDVTSTLSPGKHSLVITPVVTETAKKGQLRIESVCVAGE